MNIGTGATRKRSRATPRLRRHAGSQLNLLLELDSRDEDALRAAWTRCGLPVPYHVALRTRPLAICLGCLADAMQRKTCMDRFGADGERGADRASK